MMDQRYETIKLIGKGRIGSVYEAEDTVLGRKVALRRFFDSDEIKKDPEECLSDGGSCFR